MLSDTLLFFRTDKLVALYALYIDKDYRKKGLSSKMMEAATAACHEKLSINVFLGVSYSPYSIRAAKKIGFTELFVKFKLSSKVTLLPMS